MLACTLVYYAVMAGFLTFLLARLSHERIWFFAVIALVPILLWVNPNFPYCLVIFSMSFALLLVLEGRSDLAFVPGSFAFLLLAGLLTAVFGWRSVLATMLPLQGAQFYKEKHFDFLVSGMEFLHPAGTGIPHFIFSRAAWWTASSIPPHSA
jgi:hypothetical protein